MIVQCITSENENLEDQVRAFVFIEIEPFVGYLLNTIVYHASGPDRHAAAYKRLFSSPFSKGKKDLAKETSFLSDWKNYVEPEIKDLFRSAQEVVEADLSALPPNFGSDADFSEAINWDSDALSPMPGTQFVIPIEHAEAWLNALNQARIVLAELNKIEESEMLMQLSFPPKSKQEQALFQIHFYETLQVLLLRGLGYVDL